MAENSDIFPHLSFSELQPQAEKWVKKYGIIEKVTLHHPSGDTKYFGSDYVNYVVVFEVPSLPPGTRQYRRLKQFIRDFSLDVGFDRLLDKTFVNVYKIDPGFTFRDEWDFTWRYSYQEFPDYIREEPKWLLYQQEAASASSDLDSAEISELIETESPELEREENYFVRKGKYWSIKYGGESGVFPNHEKYRYIVHLIKQAGKEVPNSDLIRAVKGIQFRAELPKGLEKEYTEISFLDSDLTPQDFYKLRDAGNDIFKKIRDAEKKQDEETAEAGKEEMKVLMRVLFDVYKIKATITQKGMRLKQLYRSSEQVEKDRHLVKNQLRRALKDIEKHLPNLSKHLRNSITKKQVWAIYDPEHHTPWHISL